MRSLLVVLVIVGMVILALVFSEAKTGAVVSRFCPQGTNPIFVGVPGGGLQLTDCVQDEPIPSVGRTFDTYTANPQGDLRRQEIASRGFKG